MKRLFYFALLGLFALSTQNCFAQWTGAGTSTSPYQINNATDLGTLSNNVRGGNTYSNTYFILMNNLDLTGVTNFTPIGGWNSAGTSSSESNYFNGNFDGNGKTISNLTILKDSTVSSNNNIGLFGLLSSSGVIKNIGVVNARIRGYENIGAVCGKVNGSVKNCYSSGIVGGDNIVGGLCGYCDGGTIEGSYSLVNVFGDSYVGGFVGAFYYSTSINNYSLGNVKGNTYVCGFAHATWGTNEYVYCRPDCVQSGYLSLGNNAAYLRTLAQMQDPSFVTLINTGLNPFVFCYDSSNVNQGCPIFIWQNQQLVTGVYSQPATDIYGHNAKINGMVILAQDTLVSKGFLWKKLSQVNYDTILVTGNNNMSQLLTNLTLNTEYVYKAFLNTTSQSYLGEEIRFKTLPILGQGTLASPFEIQDTSGLIYLSNFVNSQNSTLGLYYKLTNNIDMSGVNNFIPIGGWNSAGTSSLESNYFNGNFDGNGKTISNLTILKDSTVSSNNNIGLFGLLNSSGVIKNIGVVNARIRGYENVGALCGLVYGNVKNCFSSGIVGGNNIVGGLCGYCDGGTIEGSYSLVNVFGNSYVGGFVGAFYQATSINNYSLGNVKGNTYVCGFAHATWGTNEYVYCRPDCVQSGYLSLGNNAAYLRTLAQMQDASFVTLINTGLNPVAFKADVQILNNGLPLLVWQEVNPIMTKQSNNITATTATVYGLITETGVTFDSIGFYYRESISNSWHSVIGNYMGNNNISANLVGLNPNTNYEFMAYMAKDTNVYLGDTLYFTTLHLPIKISTDSVLFVSSSSVKLYGYANIGSHNLIRKGFEYKKASDAIFTNVVNLLDDSDTLETKVIELSLNTSYTFRAFIESEQGIEYGNNMNFIIFESGLGKPEEQITKISLYPNPTIDQAKLQLSGINKEIRLIIIDIQGRVIKDQIIKSTNNSINTIIDLSQEPKGVYYIKLQNDNINKTEKIIKM